MNSGMKELDRLLGYDPEKGAAREIGSIPIGSVLLIRGQPGSGKTTLALQIIDRYLQSGRRRAAFISLESAPQAVVEHAYDTFGFYNLKRSNDGKVKNLVELNRDELWEALGEFSKATSDQFGEKLVGCIAARSPGYDPRKANTGHESEELLIFVDSLLLLADIASRKLEDGHNLRTGLNCIRDSAKSQLKNAYLIFTCEYHQQETIINESFYCDIEIRLSPEPLAGGPSRESFSPIGYSIERHITDWNPSQAIISRPFCRVLKNRHWPNQARRCAYDIVDGQGITFYETYPGDGQIVLFAENERQTECWQEFFEAEVPYRYPAMRFLTFDRSGLQRTFASQRALKHIPERLDLYLTSLDTYWINWYIEFCQRGAILGFLTKAFPRGRDGTEDHVPQIICIVHELCLMSTMEPADTVQSIYKGITEFLAAKNVVLTDAESKILRACVLEIVNYFGKPEAHQGMLLPVKRKHLRLFGEHRSDFIKSLNRSDITERRPIHCLQQRPNSTHLLSVPYDSNVGLMLYRKDLIKRDVNPRVLCQDIINTYDKHRELITKFLNQSDCKEWLGTERGSKRDSRRFSETIVETYVAHLVDHVLRLGHPPITWEEVIALCGVQKLDCLIETRTFDTLAATFLELLWNCGGDLKISPRYQLFNKAHTTERLFHAICLLHRMFKDGIIPIHSAVDPLYMRDRYGENTRQGTAEGVDWLFARHWYSTAVDLLTHKPEDKPSASHLWEQKGAQVEIMPLPISLSHYIEQRESGKSDGEIVHRSCWGEWHFAVHGGSENKALALDIINNLMSSSKICDRAFRNASLPTVEAFYTRYPKVKCFNIPERPADSVPSWTFGDIHDKLFPFAKSRSQIFDYRHCVREIHTVIEAIQAAANKRPVGNSPLDVGSDLLKALQTISEFQSKGLMLA